MLACQRRREARKETCLSEPSINDAQVIIMVLGALGQLRDLTLVQVAFALVLAHLTKNGIFLKVLD